MFGRVTVSLVILLGIFFSSHSRAEHVGNEKSPAARSVVDTSKADDPGEAKKFVVGNINGVLSKTEFTGKEDHYEKNYGRRGDGVSPNGRFIVGMRGPNLVVLDAATGKTVVSIDGPGASNLIFSPDNARFAVTSVNTVYLFSLPDGQLITRFKHGEFIRFSPDGRRLLSYTEDLWKESIPKSMLIVDAENGKTIATIPTGGLVRNLKFSKGAAFIRTYDQKTRVVDLEKGEELHVEGESLTNSHYWSPDLQYIVREPGVTVVNSRTGKKVRSFEGWYSNISPDSKIIAVNEHNDKGKYQTRLIDISSGKEVLSTRFDTECDSINSTKFTPDGKRALITDSGWSGRHVRLFDTSSGKLITDWDTEKEFGGGIERINFSPNSKTAVIKPFDKEKYSHDRKIVDMSTGKLIAEFKNVESEPDNNIREYPTPPAYSPNGRWIIIRDQDGIKVFDTENARTTLTLPLDRENNILKRKTRFSPDSRYAVVSHYVRSGSVKRLIDLVSGEEVPLDRFTGRVYSIGFAEDGTIIGDSANGVFRLRRAGAR